MTPPGVEHLSVAIYEIVLSRLETMTPSGVELERVFRFIEFLGAEVTCPAASG